MFFAFTVLLEETKPGCLIFDGTHHTFDTKFTYKRKKEKLKLLIH